MFINPDIPNRWIIGVTGASGTVYARRLIQTLITAVPDIELEVVVSEAALRVMREEENLAVSIGRLRVEDLIGKENSRVRTHSNKDIGASIASGSYRTRGMVIIPCSMKTLAAVSSGYADNLIQRAADVTLKERRTLVLVPRETPLSAIHLENMLRLAKLGVSITPAMPGFYSQPKSIGDIVDALVIRVIDQMGISIDSPSRWRDELPAVEYTDLKQSGQR